jgi:hypothetical protein
MTSQQAREAECRAIAGEIVSTMRLISEGVTPLTKSQLRNIVIEVEHELAALARLGDQLP